jgi:4-amino-4-deoxy-L-arabinose transferase-like glycosyltransferase
VNRVDEIAPRAGADLQRPPESARSLLNIASSKHLLIVLTAAALLFFVGLGSLPLVEPDEGRNAEVAREMLVGGNWITPHFDTLPYLDKPAIFFWLVAGSMRLFGISEWAARFPSAFSALATAVLVWLLTERMFRGPGIEPAGSPHPARSGRAGLLAAIVWVVSPLVIAFAREVILDMTLTLLLTLAMFSFWCAANGSAGDEGFRQPWLNVGLFGSMGLATFVKGPIGFVLPLLTIFAYQALRGRLRQLSRLRWGVGLAVFLATTLPWFIVVSVRNPSFPRYALWEETILRFTTAHQHRAGSIFYYVPVFFGGFFPWSFCLCFAAWNRLSRWRALKQEKYNAELFLLLWAAIILVFFSIAHSKLPGYILPATVPLSILVARIWPDVEDSVRRADWLTAAFAVLIAIGILVAASPQLFRITGLGEFGRKIPPNVMPFIKPELFFTGMIMAAIGVLGRSLIHRLRSSRRKLLSAGSFALLAVTVPLLIVRWALPLKSCAEAYSSRELARQILSSPEKDAAIYGYYYFRTSLPFYLRRPVGLVTSGGSEITSNYLVSQFQEQRRQATMAKNSGISGMPRAETPAMRTDKGGREPGTILPQVPSSRQDPSGAGRVLIDSQELKSLGHSSVAPFLVMARNSLVSDAATTVGRVQPVWSAWEYSVLEAEAAGSGKIEPPTVVIGRIIRRNGKR